MAVSLPTEMQDAGIDVHRAVCEARTRTHNATVCVGDQASSYFRLEAPMSDLTILDAVVTTLTKPRAGVNPPATPFNHWLKAARGVARATSRFCERRPLGAGNDLKRDRGPSTFRTYRQDKKVPMQRLRPFISGLRSALGIPYPSRTSAHGSVRIASYFSIFRRRPPPKTPFGLSSRENTATPDTPPSKPSSWIEWEFCSTDEAVVLRPMGKKSPVALDPHNLVRSRKRRRYSYRDSRWSESKPRIV